MRAVVQAGFSSIDGLTIETIDDPTPGPYEATVEVEVAALNHRDLWMVKRDTSLDTMAEPFVPGSDLAGTVAETGKRVQGVEEGDRVVLCPNITCGRCRYCREGPENACEAYDIYDGAFAERALVDASRLVPLPEAVSFESAAALPIAYMTAYRMLRQADAQPGDRVFIPGATGGVGTAAIQLAAALGAETIGSSRSAGKLAEVEPYGLDYAIENDDPDRLLEAVTGIGPVDVVINHLGGEYTRIGLESLRRAGTMVVCGRTTGAQPEIDLRELYWEHKRLLGSTMGTQLDLQRVVSLVDVGDIEPLISRTVPLSDVRDLYRSMDNRNHVGKLLLRPPN